MGAGFSNIIHSIRGREPRRILMLGLNGAGKTTILYQLKSDEMIAATPTMGFNMEMIAHQDARFAVWDVSGDPLLRFLWSKYLHDTEAVIFVVDAANEDRIAEACTEFQNLMENPRLRNVVVVVLAHKQDLPNAFNKAEVEAALMLTKITQKYVVLETSCSATNVLEEVMGALYQLLIPHKSRNM